MSRQNADVVTVDGMNARKGAQRLIRWLQKPVDTNQPGYAKEEGKKTEGFFKRYTGTSKL